MDKLDKIIKEQVMRYTSRVIKEDSLTGYAEGGSSEDYARNIAIKAIENSNFDVMRKEESLDATYNGYYVYIDCEAETSAWWQEGVKSHDYDVPDDPDELMDEDSAKIVYAKIDVSDKDGNTVGEFEADDEVLDLLTSHCDFSEFNTYFASNKYDFESWYGDEKYDEYKNRDI